MLHLNIGLKPKPAPRPRAAGRVHNPADYTSWKEAFGFLVNDQIRVTKADKGAYSRSGVPVSVEVTLYPTRVEVTVLRVEATRPAKITGDVDNYAKAVLDALQDCGVIQNDRQVQRLYVMFGEDSEG